MGWGTFNDVIWGFQDDAAQEGIIGHGKSHFGLDRIRYTVKDGEEMWIRLGLLAMNLSTALKKMQRRRFRGDGMAEAGAAA